MGNDSSFVRERMVQAREAAGIPAAALARVVGVVRQTISNYEAGVTVPRPDMVRRLAQALQVQPSYFYAPIPNRGYEHSAVFFRDNASSRRLDQFAAGRTLQRTEELLLEMLNYVELPPLRFLDLEMPSDPRDITNADIEEAARELRELWDLGAGPIRRLVGTAELNGIVLQRLTVGNEHLDGLSMWSDIIDRPVIVLNDEKDSCVRSRFDLAHELGHMVLHRYIPMHLRAEPALYRNLERQAHRFASSLLLPSTTWAFEVGAATLGIFQSLKPKWLASIAAQVRRAYDLDLIDEDRYRGLMRQLSSRAWRKVEPLDDVLPVEKPVLLRRATELIAASSPRALSAIMNRAPYGPELLSKLTGAPIEHFDPVHQLVRFSEPSSGRIPS